MTLNNKENKKNISTRSHANLVKESLSLGVSKYLNAQVVQSIKDDFKPGFKLSLLKSKYNFNTNECSIALKLNIANPKSVEKLIYKVFNKKTSSPFSFLYSCDFVTITRGFSNYTKAIQKKKTKREIIKNKQAKLEMAGFKIEAITINGHVVFKK